MPILPENKNRYPSDWPEISARIKERDGNKCKTCGVPNHTLIYRPYKDERWELWPEGMQSEALTLDGEKPVYIVLTVMHLDHNPENCNDENLASGCQRCHNRYDTPHRAHTRNRRKYKGMNQLF
jgi:hypothetical protein